MVVQKVAGDPDFQTPCQKTVFCMVLVVFAKLGVRKMTRFFSTFFRFLDVFGFLVTFV